MMAVGGINNNYIYAYFNQRSCSFKSIFANAHGSTYP